MKPTPTRTIGPLHPEDLEPHRFEDLVRQLAYDFRPWRKLEATGGAGSDDGFDARGYEIVGVQAAPSIEREADEEADDNGDEADATADRLWMIQCKREKAIGPTKLRQYVKAITADQPEPLHGLVFAAACKFSKTAYDAFNDEVRKVGLAESYLWGAADIEDQLFQPKNDHLLFAYFGISLQTRRRSLKTEIRAKLATKRKCIKHLRFAGTILVRDPTDERYPYLDRDLARREDQGRWAAYTVADCKHDGVHVLRSSFFAYVNAATEEWDIAETVDDARLSQWEDPWHDDKVQEGDRAKIHEQWAALPHANRAKFDVRFVIPYENILDIDVGGDEIMNRSHVYTVPWVTAKGPFSDERIELRGDTRDASGEVLPRKGKRVKIFPRLKGGKGFAGFEYG